MIRARSTAVLVGVVAAALVFSATGSLGAVGKAGSAKTQAAATVTIAESGDQDFSSLDVLKWVDLLKKSGINVKYNVIADASTALQTVVSGAADLWVGNFTTPILADVNANAGVEMIAANDQASDYVLLGGPGVTLQNVAGKTMGQDSPGSSGVVAAQIAMKKEGVDPSTVKYVTVGGSSARLTAILAGKIDLAPIHYPLALTALAAGKGITNLINTGKLLGPYDQSGIVASSSWISKNKSLTQTIVNAFINAERWAASNKYGYISYAGANNLTGGLDGGQMAQTWDFYKSVNFFAINGGICDKYITDTITLNWSLGLLPKPIPLARNKLFDREFVVAYLKAHHQKPETC